MKLQLPSILLTGILFLFVISFTQCCNDSSSCTIDSSAVYTKYQKEHFAKTGASKNNPNELLSILELFEADSSHGIIGDGEVIPFAKADGCTAAFKDLMNRKGFPDNDPADPSDIGKLTLSESFKGDGMIDFLRTAKIAGATEIDLRFGKYDSAFLNGRFTSAAERPQIQKRMGRITIFLYPVQVNGNSSTLVGNSAYDLGNLHP